LKNIQQRHRAVTVAVVKHYVWTDKKLIIIAIIIKNVIGTDQFIKTVGEFMETMQREAYSSVLLYFNRKIPR